MKSNKEEINLLRLTDLYTPWSILVISTLNIPKHMNSGLKNVNDLAMASNCNPRILTYLLRSLTDKGVFEEPSPGEFELNSVSEQFLDPSAQLYLNLNGIFGRFAKIWTTLLEYTKTGESVYHELYGLPFYEDLKANPELSKNFDELIGPLGHGKPNPNFNVTSGWDNIKNIIDIGGGTGAFLAELLLKHDHLKGKLLDLPDTADRALKHIKNAGIVERVEVIGQSFFEPLPKGLDIYLLKGVINNWSDDDAIRILERCAEASKPDSKIIILSDIFSETEPRSLPIDMILTNGKCRSLGEYREIIKKAGLEIIDHGKQENNYYCIECQLK
jgi:2,7-dihydroxy-5-methyl-1-naphthoate 7-O-methyltransferase